MTTKKKNLAESTKQKLRGDDNTSTALSLSRELLKAAIAVCRSDARTFSGYVRWLIRRDMDARGVQVKAPR